MGSPSIETSFKDNSRLCQVQNYNYDSFLFDGVEVGSQHSTPRCLGSEAGVTGLGGQGD